MAYLSKLILLSTVIAASIALPARGHAQADPNEAEARALFQAGEAAAAADRWPDAVRNFRQSYRLVARYRTLFNLSTALRSAGEFSEACDSFDLYLREYGHVHRQLTQLATGHREDSCSRVATVTIVGIPEGVPFTVRIDGRPINDATPRPITLRVNRGSHGLTVSHREYLPFEWAGEVNEDISIQAEIRPIPVVQEPVQAPPPGQCSSDSMCSANDRCDFSLQRCVARIVPPAEPEPAPRRRWYQRAGFWVPVSLVILGGGFAATYALRERAQNTVNGSPAYPDMVVNLGDFR